MQVVLYVEEYWKIIPWTYVYWCPFQVHMQDNMEVSGISESMRIVACMNMCLSMYSS